jgi:hypothetical protein
MWLQIVTTIGLSPFPFIQISIFILIKILNILDKTKRVENGREKTMTNEMGETSPR